MIDVAQAVADSTATGGTGIVDTVINTVALLAAAAVGWFANWFRTKTKK